MPSCMIGNEQNAKRIATTLPSILVSLIPAAISSLLL